MRVPAPARAFDQSRISREVHDSRLESMARIALVVAALVLLSGTIAAGQKTPTGPPQDVEQVVGEASTEPQQPFSFVDRPVYRALQDIKKELNEKFGINFAIEDTLIYQATS